MLTPAEAEGLIAQNLPSLPIESLPVGHCAGAVLRENVYAERDQPPFDRVAMDGIAVNARCGDRGRASCGSRQHRRRVTRPSRLSLPATASRS